jgi:hypothetical protein
MVVPLVVQIRIVLHVELVNIQQKLLVYLVLHVLLENMILLVDYLYVLNVIQVIILV